MRNRGLATLAIATAFVGAGMATAAQPAKYSGSFNAQKIAKVTVFIKFNGFTDRR